MGVGAEVGHQEPPEQIDGLAAFFKTHQKHGEVPIEVLILYGLEKWISLH